MVSTYDYMDMIERYTPFYRFEETCEDMDRSGRIIEAGKILAQDGDGLRYAPDDIKNEVLLVLVAINQYSWAYTWAPNDIQENRQVALFANQKGYRCKALFPEKFHSDPDFIFGDTIKKVESLENVKNLATDQKEPIVKSS